MSRSKSNGSWVCRSFMFSDQVTDYLNENKDFISNVTITNDSSEFYVFFYTEKESELKGEIDY